MRRSRYNIRLECEKTKSSSNKLIAQDWSERTAQRPNLVGWIRTLTALRASSPNITKWLNLTDANINNTLADEWTQTCPSEKSDGYLNLEQDLHQDVLMGWSVVHKLLAIQCMTWWPCKMTANVPFNVLRTLPNNCYIHSLYSH